MKNYANGLSEAQLSAIELLVCGKSYPEVEKELKLSNQAINNWMQQDILFKTEYNARTTALFQQMGNVALQKVMKLMESKNERVALDACRLILDKAYANKNEVVASGEGFIINIGYDNK